MLVFGMRVATEDHNFAVGKSSDPPVEKKTFLALLSFFLINILETVNSCSFLLA